jgi:predicted lipid carrier protein YhbT
MSPANPHPLPAGLPAWMAPLHSRLCGWVEKLPTTPPSFVAAQVLDRLLWPRLPDDARDALSGHCIELRVTDLGLRLRLRLSPLGFTAAGEQGQPALRISASSTSYLRLARGEEDPDRLFFERALVMEGDTELGLVLKNTLDAIGPLWPLQSIGEAVARRRQAAADRAGDR